MTPQPEIDLKEYGAMCQKIDDLDRKLTEFITNDFKHLRAMVLWMFGVSLTALAGLVVNLILLLAKQT